MSFEVNAASGVHLLSLIHILHLHPALAPYKCAVLPLSKKLGDKAMEIRNELSKYRCV